jgi:hypothetical protein
MRKGELHLGLLCALACGFLLVGCMTEQRVKRSSWDSLRQVADPPPDQASADASGRGQVWAIELDEFEGDQRLKQAYRLAASVRESGQIADVWFDDYQNVATVYVGRFNRLNDPEAQRTLDAVRSVRIDGKRPFRRSELQPIQGGQSVVSELDLSQHSGYRSLLVHVFDAGLGENHRLAAEELARELRQDDGDRPALQSFYYHGPRQSMVTVGLFTLSDFVPVNGIDTYGPRIRETQEHFPRLLQNRKPVPGTNTGTDDGMEPTVIVNVP